MEQRRLNEKDDSASTVGDLVRWELDMQFPCVGKPDRGTRLNQGKLIPVMEYTRIGYRIRNLMLDDFCKVRESLPKPSSLERSSNSVQVTRIMIGYRAFAVDSLIGLRSMSHIMRT
jgi:hypothetical protein